MTETLSRRRVGVLALRAEFLRDGLDDAVLPLARPARYFATSASASAKALALSARSSSGFQGKRKLRVSPVPSGSDTAMKTCDGPPGRAARFPSDRAPVPLLAGLPVGASRSTVALTCGAPPRRSVGRSGSLLGAELEPVVAAGCGGAPLCGKSTGWSSC